MYMKKLLLFAAVLCLSVSCIDEEFDLYSQPRTYEANE